MLGDRLSEWPLKARAIDGKREQDRSAAPAYVTGNAADSLEEEGSGWRGLRGGLAKDRCGGGPYLSKWRIVDRGLRGGGGADARVFF